MKFKICLLIAFLLLSHNLPSAQNDNTNHYSNTVATKSFWENWYVQLGGDMTLLNPYGCNFSNVFPNGKSFGINAGLGKWFTPEFGMRGKISWENGIFDNDHAKWLSPSSPGRNHRNGGFATATLDIQLNLHNILSRYNPERFWNLSLYPRIGAISNFDADESGPLLGFGIGNTFRINDRWDAAADASYQVMPTVLGNNTGTGSGNNGYFDITIGVQYKLGDSRFYRPGESGKRYRHAVLTMPLLSNWFVQAGAGMSLLNLYGSNFANVFPNGKTLGINAAIGKWFTPEAAVRCGFNWQNGIIGNSHLTWLDTAKNPGSNHQAGGFAAAYIDVFLNIHNIMLGYNDSRRWNAIIFPRAGVNSNFESGSGSPSLGIGTEHTFRLNGRISIFADIVYQMTTGELMGKKSVTGSGCNSNGWFDFNIGIEYSIGKEKFTRIKD